MLTPADSASTNNAPLQTSDRHCENPECSINKLITMVPKRKATQFISDPVVAEKPSLVNGFTAVFQVDGNSAKLMDIKHPNGEGPTKAIYRIIPNSHVHVVNYVVVDTDEVYLKKITENDPATMQKLLTSQKESADQMLKKIMSGQGSTATAAMTTVVSTINNNIPNNISLPPQTTANITASASTPASALANQNVVQKAAIKLPLRMHPHLKITAVASADNVNTSAISTNLSNVIPAAPFITPVPLTNLQTPAAATQSITAITSVNNSTPSTIETVNKPTYDKMQAEINDLRRTVAMLAEAQAKTQNQQQTPPGISRPVKRPRSTLPK